MKKAKQEQFTDQGGVQRMRKRGNQRKKRKVMVGKMEVYCLCVFGEGGRQVVGMKRMW